MNTIRTLATACALSFCLAMPAHADDPDAAAAVAARDVIQSQLDAFEADSAKDAYEFAAPNIRRMFPTAQIFGRMVRQGYPMVWDPADTEFLDAKQDGDRIVQRLRLIDRQGQPYIAVYMMMQVDGVWRIAGVSITRDDSFGV